MAFDRKAYMRAWQKRRQDRWRAIGACPECGEPVTRFVRCLRHRQIAMASYYRRKAAHAA